MDCFKHNNFQLKCKKYSWIQPKIIEKQIHIYKAKQINNIPDLLIFLNSNISNECFEQEELNFILIKEQNMLLK